MSVYEVHLGSWVRGEDNRYLTYRELADRLVAYAKRDGLYSSGTDADSGAPVCAFVGLSSYGLFCSDFALSDDPEDFMYFVDRCHQENIGVIIDWVPAHFPKDAHGLAFFDGTALYEHEDSRLGEHRDWGTLIFNFGRNEVRSFLISNAMFWLKKYHIDGLRVDAVASMLYLDYSRKGRRVGSQHLWRERKSWRRLAFLRKANELVHQVPGAMTIAEESTAFTGVSRPVYI